MWTGRMYAKHRFATCLIVRSGHTHAWRSPRGATAGGRFHPDQNYDHPVISLWERQWLSHQWEKQPPAKADTFQVMASVPTSSVPAINSATGLPRQSDGRSPASQFVVIWVPGSNLEKMKAQKAMDGRVLAIGRSGQRYGVRREKANGPAMWAELKPGQQCVDPMSKLTFTVGPLPRGVSNQILQNIANGIGWQARPVQPHHSSADGVFWAFVASTPPSQECVEVDGKLITIVAQPTQKSPVQQPVLIAPKATKEFLMQPGEPRGIDPLQVNDPWAGKHTSAPTHMPTPIKNALTALAQRTAVPTPDPRVDALEERMTRTEKSQKTQACSS